MGGTCCGGRELDNKYKNKRIGTKIYTMCIHMIHL